MKIKKYYLILFALTLAIFSCNDDDKVTDDVQSEFTVGGILRSIEILSNTLNSSDPLSEFSVIVEEQDVEDGALLKSVSVFVSMKDLTPDNGTTVSEDKFVKTIDASAFSPGPFGLPRSTITVTFGEAESALGIAGATLSHTPGDLFVFELKLELTDGRIFDSTTTGSSVTGGFFNSSFLFNALISCTPEPGTYTLEIQDAYGDGWQSDGMGVSIDGVTTNFGAGSQGSFFVLTVLIDVPVGTESLTWNWPGDSFPDEVSFQIFAPDGSLLGAFIGQDPLSNYGCGCSIVEVNGVPAVVADSGLLPVLLCATN